MTRSASQRQNGNARQIVANLPISAVQDRFARDGAFGLESARRFVTLYAENCRKITTFPPAWTLDEVNWPLVAELLNRKLRRFIAAELRIIEAITGFLPGKYPQLPEESSVTVSERMLYARAVTTLPLRRIGWVV